jgi:uncharacterized membrane protein YfcA
MTWAICFFVGLCSGFLAGLLGIGGGTVIVPTLIFAAQWLGIGADDAARVAMATALAIVIPTSISSAQAHASRDAIDWGAFRSLAPGIAAGALAGTLAACAFGGRLAQAAFVGFAWLAAWRLLSSGASDSELNLAALPARPPLGPGGLRSHSVAIGLVSGLAGVGGGLLSVPLLARYIPMKRAIGTAAALGLPLAIAGLTGYAVAGHRAQCATGCVGYVFVPAVAAISLASITAAPLGASLAHHLPVRWLKRAFATLLLLVSADLSAELLRQCLIDIGGGLP